MTYEYPRTRSRNSGKSARCLFPRETRIARLPTAECCSSHNTTRKGAISHIRSNNSKLHSSLHISPYSRKTPFPPKNTEWSVNIKHSQHRHIACLTVLKINFLGNESSLQQKYHSTPSIIVPVFSGLVRLRRNSLPPLYAPARWTESETVKETSAFPWPAR